MIDLSNELTVFFITTDNDPNSKMCLNALNNQNCRFKLDIIKNYYPLSHAFQQMLIRCTTKYFIQCDSDMLLHADAVQIMYNQIIKSDISECMWCFPLIDAHLKMPIIGIKIYKNEIFQKYPFNITHPSCEIEQLDRIKKDGYTYGTSEEVLGEHSVLWTDEGIFERYFNLMQKFRLYHYSWIAKLPEKLMKIYKENPTHQNFYAVAGLLSGMFTDDIIVEEKDVRNKRKSFSRLRSFLETPTSATLYLNNRCNFSCSWCRRQNGTLEDFPDMKPELVHTLLNKFPTITGLCICGYGSPLLSPNLLEIISAIKQHKNKCIGIITNGSLLKQRLPELISNPPSYISVSLNASNAEDHERITQTKTWDDVIEGIKASVASPIPTYVSAVITTENLNDIPNIIKLVYSLGVKTLYLHNMLPSEDHVSDEDNFWKLVLQKEHETIIEEFKKIPESSIVAKWPVLIDRTGGTWDCEFPWRSIAIDGSGSISICNSVLPCHSKNGNIKDSTILQNNYCMNFKDSFCKKDLSLPCSKCFRNWSFM